MAVLVAILANRAAASTWVVSTLDDTGAGSLRLVLTQANAAPGADRIEFADEGFGNVVGVELAIDLLLAYAAGDQLRVLRPEIEDQDLLVHGWCALWRYSTR